MIVIIIYTWLLFNYTYHNLNFILYNILNNFQYNLQNILYHKNYLGLNLNEIMVFRTYLKVVQCVIFIFIFNLYNKMKIL